MPAEATTDSMRALDDLVVLDVATLFAGPSAATVMADFGANVIKIEQYQEHQSDQADRRP